eukprot:5067271-Pyramimonas_sp.AAC.1
MREIYCDKCVWLGISTRRWCPRTSWWINGDHPRHGPTRKAAPVRLVRGADVDKLADGCVSRRAVTWPR